MMRIIEAWKAEGGEWPASTKDIASFALRKGLYSAQARLKELCARDLAKAMREEYIRDSQGRPVRRLHAARLSGPEESGAKKQLTLWADIDTAERDFMEVAFQQRREQIVGDCRQLSNDVDYFNDRHPTERPIQLYFDFTDDVEEANMPEEYVALPPKG
jgi:hypothetical protein